MKKLPANDSTENLIRSMLHQTKHCLNCGRRLPCGHGFRVKTGYCNAQCHFEKPPKMAYLENVYGKPIREIMIDLLNRSDTMEPVSGLMGVTRFTLYKWIKKLKIQQTVIWK